MLFNLLKIHPSFPFIEKAISCSELPLLNECIPMAALYAAVRLRKLLTTHDKDMYENVLSDMFTLYSLGDKPVEKDGVSWDRVQ